MILNARGFPAWIWYCLAILIADSTASDPPLTKTTLERPSGVSSTILSASFTVGGAMLFTVPA